jgi:lipopolysaccharide export system ATP-binding protein
VLRLRERGIGILISDHNVRDTFKIADRALIIDRGEILVEGKPAAVAANPKARERFLGTEFSFGGERVQDFREAIRSPSVSPRKNRNRKK